MTNEKEPISPTLGAKPPYRYYLPDERPSKTIGFKIYPPNEDDPKGDPPDPVKGTFVVGLYPDGTPGELFVNVKKVGSEIHGWADCWAIAVSMLLQFGVPPAKIYEKFKWHMFKPQGITSVREIFTCKSIIDLVMKWMSANLPPTAKSELSEADTEYAAAIESVVEGMG
jgi:hypothetical protein